MATLTGAIVVGLGQERVGLFSNSNQLTKSIQSAADAEEDKAVKKKAKKMIKKLNNVVLGREKIKLIVSDKTGNSAIISDKANKKKA